jgi:cytochrome c
MPDSLRYQITVSLLLILVLLVMPGPALAGSVSTDLGKPLGEPEIAQYAITIFSDGTNLPSGQGSVAQGAALYKNQCAMCHGERGIEGPAARLAGSDGWFSLSDPLRVLRIRKYPILLISVGGLWPYATTIYDYIRRAMPHYAPKSLSNDEVYALTAQILYLNDLVDEETVLDKKSILKVVMPGKERSVSAWNEPLSVTAASAVEN